MQHKTNICMIGGSGVGKSTVLKYVLAEIARVDPYRARTDGARAGEDRYVCPDMLDDLMRLNRELDGGEAKVTLSSTRGDMKPCKIGGKECEQWVQIYTNATFFTVRKDRQVLLHHGIDLQAPNRKVELFAPVFSAILRSMDARGAIRFLHGAKTVFLLLNPLTVPVARIRPESVGGASGWSTDDWVDLQFQRSNLLGEFTGLDAAAVAKKRAKMVERVDQLPYEVAAWQELIALSATEPEVCGFVECLGWTHFEYKYLGCTEADVERTAKAAGADILKAAAAAGLDECVRGCFR